MKYQQGHTYKDTLSYWNQKEVLEILGVFKVRKQHLNPSNNHLPKQSKKQ